MQINQQTNKMVENNNCEGETPLCEAMEVLVDHLQAMGCSVNLLEHGYAETQFLGSTLLLHPMTPTTVRVWDPQWFVIDVGPELRAAHAAAHICNSTELAVIVPIMEDGKVSFNSRIDLRLHRGLPDNEAYIRDALYSFFYAKNAFYQTMQGLIDLHEQKQEPQADASENTDTETVK